MTCWGTRALRVITAMIGAVFLFGASTAIAQDYVVADRSEGAGPYKRLILRGGYMIDGSGAPAQGPVDIVIENDRIVQIKAVGAPKLDIDPDKRPAAGDYEIDVSGQYILPGLINLHSHIHFPDSGQGVSPEYIFKLQLAHGITTIRDVGNGKSMDWLIDLKKRSNKNDITAPRIYPFIKFFPNDGTIDTPSQARSRVRDIANAGGDGIKFFTAPEEILWAALDEAEKQGLETTMHHAQLSVTHANVIHTSEHGLDAMEHWYGLPEAMFTDRKIQDYPLDYIYHDEQNRFGEAGRLWEQAAPPYSDKWNSVMDTLLERDFNLIPTFTIYMASRDWMRSRRAEWHDEYTMPSLWDFYRPDRNAHGSYWFDWGTEQEMDWRNNYQLWMTFINEYKNRGGKVGAGADSGYIYSTYGFGYIQELELLREAGFHPLEVIQSATLTGAQILGAEDEIGSIQVGKKADLIIVGENPLANLKVLYGTGHLKLNDETRKVERVGGVNYTIKDGIIYDAKALLEDVRSMVQAQKDERGIAPGPMPIETQE